MALKPRQKNKKRYSFPKISLPKYDWRNVRILWNGMEIKGACVEVPIVSKPRN